MSKKLKSVISAAEKVSTIVLEVPGSSDSWDETTSTYCSLGFVGIIDFIFKPPRIHLLGTN